MNSWTNLFTRDTENIQKYRLSASQLNYVNYELAKKYGAKVSDNVNDFHTVNSNGKEFVICPTSKDAKSANNNSTIPDVGSTLQRLEKTSGPSEGQADQRTRLMHGYLCRGFFKIPIEIGFQRHHAILLEMNIKDRILILHDSQDFLRYLAYPLDHFNELLGFKFDEIQYRPYNVQTDVYSCGYYALSYMEHILSTGSSKGCENIKLDVKNLYKDRDEFLDGWNVVFGDVKDKDLETEFGNEKEIDDLFTPSIHVGPSVSIQNKNDNEVHLSPERIRLKV